MEPEVGMPHQPVVPEPPLVEPEPEDRCDEPHPRPPLETGEEAPDEAWDGGVEGDEDEEDGSGERPRTEDGAAAADLGLSHLTIGSVESEQTQTANTIHNHYGEPRSRPPERLTRRHLETLEAHALVRRLRGIEWSEETLRPLEQQIERARFLIITGEAGWGKGTLALGLAETLLRRPGGPSRALVGGRPPRDVQVDPGRLASELRDSVIVLEDAFVHGNPSLSRLVEQLDANRFQSLDDALRSAGCWMLLTSSTELLPADPARLDGLGAHRALTTPPVEELRRTLYRLAQLRLSGEGSRDDDRELVERLLEGSGEAICGRLRTLPRVAAFVDGYLLDAARGGIAWDCAVDRVDGLADWLLAELPAEPPAWSFAVALTLASAVPGIGDPPLLQFDLLWRELDAAFREAVADDASAARSLADLGVGDRLLRQARCELAGSRPPSIRFRDPGTSERLWRVMLDGPGRQIAGLLLAWLRRLVDGDDASLRETAARALGRLGTLDPERFTLALIDRWILDEDERCFDGTLGGMLQGALAAGDDDYRHLVLRRLGRAVRRGERGTSFARAAALRDVGLVDLDLALDELRSAIDDDARTMLERLWRANQEALGSIDRLAARRGPDGTVGEKVRQQRFANAAARHVPAATHDAFRALRYGLIGLCLTRDPVDVLDRLRPWLEPPRSQDEEEGRPGALAGVTALALLSEQGVLHWLENRPLSVAGTNGEQVESSRLLLAVVGDAGGAERLAGALAEALAASIYLPPPLASVLRTNWRTLLIHWGRSAGRCEGVDEVLRDLLRHLLSRPTGGVGEETFALLQGDPCFLAADGRLSRFASEVLAG